MLLTFLLACSEYSVDKVYEHPPLSPPSLPLSTVLASCLEIPPCAVNFNEAGPESECVDSVTDQYNGIIQGLTDSAGLTLSDILNGSTRVTALSRYEFNDATGMEGEHARLFYSFGDEGADALSELADSKTGFYGPDGLLIEELDAVRWDSSLGFASLRCSAEWYGDIQQNTVLPASEVLNAFFGPNETIPAFQNSSSYVTGYDESQNLIEAVNINDLFIYDDPLSYYIDGAVTEIEDQRDSLLDTVKALSENATEESRSDGSVVRIAVHQW